MAKIVLGIGASHSPQMSQHWKNWQLMADKDREDPRMNFGELLKKAPPNLERVVNEATWEQRAGAIQAAIAELSNVLDSVRPDVVVMFGDDQHEQFLDDNMPALAIYNGDSFPVIAKHWRAPWMAKEAENWAPTDAEYPNAKALADHLLLSLIDQEFDLARTNHFREDVGIGHAFGFLYRRIWPGTRVPMLPIMVNTYYPPNQPTPKRCYELGQAVKRAVESWESDARVAVIASGGLSHVIVDEEVDEQTLDGLRNKDPQRLWSLPRPRLKGGTSEVLNWVALGGVVESMPMTLLEYIPAYRSLAGTGVGAGFAYWR